MRRSSTLLSLLVAAALLAPPASVSAQVELVAFDRVQQLYREGQPRAAAQALAAVSAEFRQEIGRCKDPEVGAKLIELEPRLDALINRLGNNRIPNEQALTAEFSVFDRALAENHLQLAELGWGQRRYGRLDAVGRDLDLAARYLERSARWSGRALDPATREAITNARASAAAMVASPSTPPADGDRHVTALAALVRGAN